LHLEPGYNDQFAHPVADRTLFQVEIVHREVFESLVDAGGTFFKHLHLLIAEGHIVEHHEEVEFVSATRFKIDYVHNPVSLLKEIESTFILLALYKSVCAVV